MGVDRDAPRPFKGRGLVQEPRSDSKLAGFGSVAMERLLAGESVAAIIKVAKPDYVPSRISPSTKISKYIFTARILHDDLTRLEGDPSVVSIELGQKLRSLSE